MSTSAVYQTIETAVANGKLSQPFRARDVVKACPSLNPETVRTFLPKHERNSRQEGKKYLKRMSRGSYKII